MRQFIIVLTLLVSFIGFYIAINSYLINQSREAQLEKSKITINSIQNDNLNSKRVSDGKSQNRTKIESLYQNCTDQNVKTDANLQTLDQIYSILNYYDQLNRSIYESNNTCNEEIAKLNQTLQQIQPKSIQITNYTNAGICQIQHNGTYAYVSFSYKMIKLLNGIAWDYYVFGSKDAGLNLTNSSTSTLVEIYNCSPEVFKSSSQKTFHKKVLTQDAFSVPVKDVHVGQGKVRIDLVNVPLGNETFTLSGLVLF